MNDICQPQMNLIEHRDALERQLYGMWTPPMPPEHEFTVLKIPGCIDRYVNVGQIDSGADVSCFPGQIFDDCSDPVNGKDDDNDGQIDNAHGLVSDGPDSHKDLIFKPDGLDDEMFVAMDDGMCASENGREDSKAGLAFRSTYWNVHHLAGEQAADRFASDLNEWSHGTRTASVMMVGNPAARLVIFRSAWASSELRVYPGPRSPTETELSLEGKNLADIADFIKRHHIKVMNISLQEDYEYLKQSLVGLNDGGVAAKRIHERRKVYWRLLFKSCPETLFVIAAGNESRDVMEADLIPSSLDEPNTLTVGSVDKYGRYASSTNYNVQS